MSDCLFIVSDLTVSKAFYESILGTSCEVREDHVFFNLDGGNRLYLSQGLVGDIQICAGLRLVHPEGKLMHQRALKSGSLGNLPTGLSEVFRCLDADGFVLTFVVPKTETFYVYFAVSDFLPEKNEPHVKVSGGYYFIGRGTRPGSPVYRSLIEAEIALENRKALLGARREIVL